jgi:ABC-2 type transport system permease protein
VVYFVLGYLLFSVLSVSVGAISANATEGHNLSMFYGLAQFIPLWFAGFLINFPKNPLWVVLSLFPITAPVATMMMVGVSDVPAWQIVTSIGVLALSVLVGLYFATKLVRVFMLMYGKRPSLADIILGLRAA